MPPQPHQILPPRKGAAVAPPVVVHYSTHLWRTAGKDAWTFVVSEHTVSIVSASAIFIVATFLAILLLDANTVWQYLLAVVIGLAALGVTYGVFVLAHLLYLTPKKLLAGKQAQVDGLRDEMIARNAEINTLKRRWR